MSTFTYNQYPPTKHTFEEKKAGKTFEMSKLPKEDDGDITENAHDMDVKQLTSDKDTLGGSQE